LIPFVKIDVNVSRVDWNFQACAWANQEMAMNNGLDDIVATETVLSDVDGAAGRLTLRGHSLDQLAGHCDYEALVELLLQGFFEPAMDVAALRTALGHARFEVFSLLPVFDAPLVRLPPTDALRALIARLPDGDDWATALRLIAAPAVMVPALVRERRGQPRIAPNASLSHSADMLRMLNARDPLDAERQALDTYLVAVSDHGLNASTFAARVVASTQAGLTSSVLAGLSALKGPLHGGAPGPVLDMLDAVGEPKRAEVWLQAALDRGERLMGFGHRIYRVRDPRADALKIAMVRLAGAGAGDSARFALAERVEAVALRLLAVKKPDRPLQTNVEFYTALLLDGLGFPRDGFTAVFAAGRVTGWIAHAREQALYGRLIRPQSRYVGVVPPLFRPVRGPVG
jgi:citrate synthase